MFLRSRTQDRIARPVSAVLLCCFVTNLVFPNISFAQSALNLPAAGTMLSTTPVYMPTMIQGLQLSATNPLEFNFIIDTGHSQLQGQALKNESSKLIKYFLSALTVPEQDMWVNLSPYEKDRIIADGFGKTEMGRDMLAQDYILKQLTASLTNPETELGKNFWDRVNKRMTQEQRSTFDVSRSTFNKVWIVPQKATIYEKNGVAFVVENQLKVMLEQDYFAEQNNRSPERALSEVEGQVEGEDYVALQKSQDTNHEGLASSVQPPASNVSSQILREIIIPELEKEVNAGKHFANLRQITNAVLLASWYKQNLKDSILGKVYIDKNKIKGVDVEDKNVKMKIYEQYLEAFKKGAYNYIKEEIDPATQEALPRKYFSGGTRVDYSRPGITNVIHADPRGAVSGAAAPVGKKFMVSSAAVENVTPQNAALMEPESAASAVTGDIVFGQTAEGKNIGQEYADLYTPTVLKVLKKVIAAGIADNIRTENALVQQEYRERQKAGVAPDFLPTTNADGTAAKIRYSNITVQDARDGNFEGPKSIPADLQVQDIHLTGPGAKSPLDKLVNKDGTPTTDLDKKKLDLRNVVHALRSGADGWMADNEDALGALGTMSLDNIRALVTSFDKGPLFWEVARTIYDEEVDAATNAGKTIESWENWKAPIEKNITTRIFRPRGGHLDDRHVQYVNLNGETVALPAIVADLVLYLTNAGPTLVGQKSTPTVYIPKMNSAGQAALYKQIIEAVQEEMGWPKGTVKVIVLIEQLPAVYQLMEIRAALGENFLGFDSGRWDYIASVIKQKSSDPNWVPPNFTEMIMTYPFMFEAESRIYQAVSMPDKNGNIARWFGGMEPQIPVVKGTISEAEKDAAIENAMKIAEVSKLREALGLGADQMDNVRALLPLLLALPENMSTMDAAQMAPILHLFQKMGVAKIKAAATWVAHPGMTMRLKNVYTKLRAAFTRIEQLGLKDQLPVETIKPLEYTPEASARLTALKDEKDAVRTVAELRFLVSVAIQYVNAYLTGRAAAALKGADLFSDPSKLFIMEDMATGEGRANLSRVWWKTNARITTITDADRQSGVIDATSKFNLKMIQTIIRQEFEKLQNAPDNIVFASSKKVQLPIAEMIVREFITSDIDLPWLIDLANQALDETDLAKATAKVQRYKEEYRKSDGLVRVTDNPEFKVAASAVKSVKLTSGQTVLFYPAGEKGTVAGTKPFLQSVKTGLSKAGYTILNEGQTSIEFSPPSFATITAYTFSVILDGNQARFDLASKDASWDTPGSRTVLTALDSIVRDALAERKISLSEARSFAAASGVTGDIDRWLQSTVTPEELNLEMFRDYDYRNMGPNLKPEMIFRLGLVWADMAIAKAEKAGITNRTVLLARDARKLDPDRMDALVAAMRYRGLNVVYIGADQSNSVTSYSWAVQQFKPLMSIFMTASHISRPENEDVWGGKVAQLQAEGEEIQSLSTKEIKQESLPAVQALLANPDLIKSKAAVQVGDFISRSVIENTVRFNTLVGLIAYSNGSLFEFGEALKTAEDPVAVLTEYEAKYANVSKPFKGLNLVVEGGNTESGIISQLTFERLGATVTLLHPDIKEIFGMHKVDPSKRENRLELQEAMKEQGASFGIAYDLDGDRGYIELAERSPASAEVNFVGMAPDNAIVTLLPQLYSKWGYAQSGRKVAVVRDALGTFGVNDAAARLGIEAFQTDAGYPYLKALKAQKRKEGYVFPIDGERSGHTWTDFSGPVENPLAVAVLFATMVQESIETKGQTLNPALDVYRETTIPYSQSERFMPFFHPELLTKLSGDPQNTNGWKFDPANPSKKPPQLIVALGKDYGVKALQKEFTVGESYKTPAGDLTVAEFNDYIDPPDEGGLYRFADVVFNLNGKLAGRFVFRASSNDPAFVASYEAPGEETPETARLRQSVAGLVLDFLSTQKIAISTLKDMALLMPNADESQRRKAFEGGNLIPVEQDHDAFLKAMGKSGVVSSTIVLGKDFSPTEPDVNDEGYVSQPASSASAPTEGGTYTGPRAIRDAFRGGLLKRGDWVTINHSIGGSRQGEIEDFEMGSESSSYVKLRNQLNRSYMSYIVSIIGPNSASAATVEEKKYGGINLDPKLFNMQIKRDGNGVPLPSFQQPYWNMNIEGFFPVIINITPINVAPLLGLNEPEKKEAVAKLSSL